MALPHRNESYKNFHQRLKSARLRWAELGFKAANTRLDIYERMAETHVTLGNTKIDYPGLSLNIAFLVMAEVYEYLFVSETAFKYPRLLSHPRIKEIFSGSPLIADESNNIPRNTLFELTMASLLERSGFAADVAAVADVESKIGPHPLCIECKRPQSFKGLNNCMRDAARQLRSRLPAVSTNARGIVALSISKAITSSIDGLGPPNMFAMNTALTKYVKAVKTSVGSLWSRYPNYDAVIVYACVAGIEVSSNQPFVNAQYSIIHRPRLSRQRFNALKELMDGFRKIDF